MKYMHNDLIRDLDLSHYFAEAIFSTFKIQTNLIVSVGFTLLIVCIGIIYVWELLIVCMDGWVYVWGLGGGGGGGGGEWGSQTEQRHFNCSCWHWPWLPAKCHKMMPPVTVGFPSQWACNAGFDGFYAVGLSILLNKHLIYRWFWESTDAHVMSL